ncbi:MAG: alpha-amylase family glycosyl hydrolase [Candidatus Parabeggiatoa sp.]|nr:alpha-amylase family glycosyl hydrolase [Candidatus Parabeggiatoa sp.]
MTMGELQDQIRPLLAKLYPDSDKRIEELSHHFVRLLDGHRAKRSEALKAFDKDTSADWFKSSETIAYILYADLFSPESPQGQKVEALRKQIHYFNDLGINLIHILPLLKSSGDAGFAVDDYETVDDRLGTNEAFQALISECHQQGIHIALDFVLNHVSDKQAWAVAAKHNDPHYHPFFLWSDSGEPWEKVPDIFPDFAPGHWDYVEPLDQWVWSTFYKRRPLGYTTDQFDFAQWDLNYQNPDVLFGMINNLLTLANWGIDVFRLDAVPFLWKQAGTSCISLPQAHTLLKIFRLGLHSVAPKAVFLAEANEQFEKLLEYFGQGDQVQIAYHFTLMPYLWQAVTTGRVKDIQTVLTNTPQIDHTHWWILSECHDELSLEMLEKPIANTLTESFLNNGCQPFRQIKGESFPRGISGTTFSLLQGDLRKIRLLWQLKLSLGWTPLFYMGEELGVENDLSYQQDPIRCQDSRFVKRVPLTEDRKNRRHQKGSKEYQWYHTLKDLISWRKQHPCLVKKPDFFETGNSAVLGFTKQDTQERMIILANCSDLSQTVNVPTLGTRTLEAFEFLSEQENI